MGDSIQIDKKHIYLHLPHYQGLTSGGCGAVAMRSIGAYYGFGPKTEAAWKKILGTTAVDGTAPRHIVRTLRNFGLKVWVHKSLQANNLIEHVQMGHPVICPIQAYGSYHHYRKTISGHYIVAIGFNDEHLFFEDSFLTKRRGYTTVGKFCNRWYDMDKFGTYFNQLGLIVKCPWKPKRQYHLYKADLIW